jgi:hypothetical protein
MEPLQSLALNWRQPAHSHVRRHPMPIEFSLAWRDIVHRLNCVSAIFWLSADPVSGYAVSNCIFLPAIPAKRVRLINADVRVLRAVNANRHNRTFLDISGA